MPAPGLADGITGEVEFQSGVIPEVERIDLELNGERHAGIGPVIDLPQPAIDEPVLATPSVLIQQIDLLCPVSTRGADAIAWGLELGELSLAQAGQENPLVGLSVDLFLAESRGNTRGGRCSAVCRQAGEESLDEGFSLRGERDSASSSKAPTIDSCQIVRAVRSRGKVLREGEAPAEPQRPDSPHFVWRL